MSLRWSLSKAWHSSWWSWTVSHSELILCSASESIKCFPTQIKTLIKVSQAFLLCFPNNYFFRSKFRRRISAFRTKMYCWEFRSAFAFALIGNYVLCFEDEGIKKDVTASFEFVQFLFVLNVVRSKCKWRHKNILTKAKDILWEFLFVFPCRRWNLLQARSASIRTKYVRLRS